MGRILKKLFKIQDCFGKTSEDVHAAELGEKATKHNIMVNRENRKAIVRLFFREESCGTEAIESTNHVQHIPKVRQRPPVALQVPWKSALQ
ncbi:hypothetical protein NQ318_006856 [Aromia moschata]|uniref:Uncharacterized protein n=1 Tax=Aromia moschata TaxID=1265417 RepID=A0AAV8YL43_9CUCU|nr:hypothetical protein NQ318_006856 [Aromia moschata]